MPTRRTPEQKANDTALAALEKIVALHDEYKDKTGLICCSLCFRSWPCETTKFAKEALTKMKGQLSQ